MGIAIAVVALIFLAAASSLVGGTYILFGLGWALLLLGLLLLGAGVHLRMGLRPNA